MYHMLLLPALPPHPPRESVARMRAHPATRGLAVEELDEVTRGLCVVCDASHAAPLLLSVGV